MTRIVFDVDCILFDACSVAESRFVTATHRPSGKIIELDNRTALYGHHKKKDGGWVASTNKLSGNDYYKPEDFNIVDGQRSRPFKVHGNEDLGTVDHYISPFEGAKKIVDSQIAAICKTLGTKDYFGFTGTGEVFRHDLATLLPYKGQREDMLSPLILAEMKAYVCKHHNITMVTGIEADDAVSMATVAGYEAWKVAGRKDEDRVIAVAVDKDAKQTSGWHYNPKKDKSPRLIEGLGSLWLNEKGDPDGCGRMWMYWQIAHGDDTDNYVANCFSNVKYAGKGAYNDLVDCSTDKEAWMKLVAIFKRLYPVKKTVTTFRGGVVIDWLYVLQEMTTMAFMLRWPNDKIVVVDVLKKLGIDYGDS